TPAVTLGEGGTPLIKADRLSERTGAQVWVKYEGLNPTASFKDRGMTMAITKAAANGAKAGIRASPGNTSPPAAAGATEAGRTRARARSQGRSGKDEPGRRPRCHTARGRRQLRRLPHPVPQALGVLSGPPRQLRQSRSHRRTEDSGLRGRRRARRCP